jgi:hypothetical protein
MSTRVSEETGAVDFEGGWRVFSSGPGIRLQIELG